MSDNPALDHETLAPIIAAAVDDLTGRPRVIGEAVARTVTARIVWHAYQVGRADAITELRTTDQVAGEIGITERAVRRLAAVHAIGWQVGPRAYLFRPEDVARLRAVTTGRRGRPKRVPDGSGSR